MQNHKEQIANKLECKLLEKEAESKSLKSQLQSLSIENNSLAHELSKVKLLCNSLISKEDNHAFVQDQLNEKEAEITKLKSEVFELSRADNDHQFKSKLQYEKDVNQVKYQLENYVAKVDNAAKIEKVNETFHNKILELESIILQYKEEEQKRIDLIQLQHQNKISSFKKQMIDYLKGDRRSKSNSVNNAELNSKLTNLHISELINELEFQSYLIESLIKENNVFKKKIAALTNDIKIHCQVETCLCEKNNKFQKQLQIISQPMEGLRTTTSNLNTNTNTHTNNKIAITNYQSQTFYKCNKNKSEDMNQTRTFRLRKDIVSKEMQIETLKTQYNATKGKLDLLNKKYSEIIRLCDEALKEMYLSKENKVDEVYLSLDEFKQCDFTKMTPKQKYAALVIIIKYILPLVNREVVVNGALDANVNQIKTKVYYDKGLGSHKHCNSESDYAYSSVSATAITESGYKKKKHSQQIKYNPLIADNKYKVKKPSFLIANNRISFSPLPIILSKQD